MKAPQITAPVIGYNGLGQRHKATHEALVWLDKQIMATERDSNDKFESWQSGAGIIDEIEYRESVAALDTLHFVRQYLQSHLDD
jgi:hypothetical protein